MSRFSQVDMDAVAPLHPSNRTAALVAGRGEHFEFSPKGGKVHSDTPLRARMPTAAETVMPSFIDLTGTAIGRLKVTGIAIDIVSNGTNWVVRCVCGSYETRKSKYVKACAAGNNPGEEEPMCDWCAKTRKLQKGIGVVRSEPLIKVDGYK